MLFILHNWAKETTLKLNGLTKQDLVNNADAVRAAIAKALGIPVDEVDFDDIVVNADGSLELIVETPSDVTIPTNFADLVTTNMQEIVGLDSATATSSNLCLT